MSIFDGTVSPTLCRNEFGADFELSGFVVTKHELEQVAWYWTYQSLENDFFCYFYELSGSHEWRLYHYRDIRLHAIALVLGDDRMRKIDEGVAATLREAMKLDDDAWRIFTSSNKEEHRAWLAVHGAEALIESEKAPS
jgi:hypothetical protein